MYMKLIKLFCNICANSRCLIDIQKDMTKRRLKDRSKSKEVISRSNTLTGNLLYFFKLFALLFFFILFKVRLLLNFSATHGANRRQLRKMILDNKKQRRLLQKNLETSSSLPVSLSVPGILCQF